MTAVLQHDVFAPGVYAAHHIGGGFATPASPPQPIPAASRRQQPQLAAVGCSPEAPSHVLRPGSPTPSDMTTWHDACGSEGPSVSCSLDCEGSTLEELVAQRQASHPQQASSGSSTPTGPGPSSLSAPASLAWQAQAQLERQRRVATEGLLHELRQQLEAVSMQVLRYAPPAAAEERDSGATAPSSVAEAAGAALSSLAQRAAALKQRLHEERAINSERLHVARWVAGMVQRAAAAADLGNEWEQEQARLQRRLEQSARMGEAMLKHHRQHSAAGEPWRQQLLNAAVSVGCSVAGAAAAVLIIHRMSVP